MLTLTTSFKKNCFIILIYHRVLDEPDYMRSSEVDIAKFSWQMFLLSNYFNVLSLEAALSLQDKNALPPRAVCISFDDGYADNYLNALPILKKNNLTAIFFIANGYLNGGMMWNDKVIEAIRNIQDKNLDLSLFDLGEFDICDEMSKEKSAQEIILKIKHLDIDKRQSIADYIANLAGEMPENVMMSNTQLSELYESGMEIGGHTVTHPILATLDDQTALHEIQENKKFLEQILDTQLNCFAYPNGKPDQDYLSNQIGLVKSLGYKVALSTRWGVVDSSSDRMQLPRFTPWDENPVKFMLRMLYMYLRS